MVQYNKFLILSNGRTGSTWLNTSLNDCSGILTRGELKWKPQSFKILPQHIVFDEFYGKISPLLEQKILSSFDGDLSKLHSYGTKFVLDPHHFLKPEAYAEIEQSIDGEIKLAHLRRSYFDIFLSFNARGAIHNVSTERKQSSSSKLDQTMHKAISNVNPDHYPKKHIYIRSSDMKAELLARMAKLQQLEQMPFVDIFQMMMIYFVHDLNIVSIIRKRKSHFFVQYEEVREKFSDITNFLGAKISRAQANEILNDPYVKKLSDLPRELVWPTGLIQLLSQILENEISYFIENKVTLNKVVIWNTQHHAYEFKSASLTNFLRSVEKMWRQRYNPVIRISGDSTFILVASKKFL